MRAGDAARRALGFLTVDEGIDEAERAGFSLLDPGSTLVGRGAEIGTGVVLYPGVVLRTQDGGRITLGPGAVLWPGTVIAAIGDAVTVGAGAEIGFEGGFTLTASPGQAVLVGERARLAGGGAVQGGTIGAGAQILGAIQARSCSLAEGGDWREPDPDRRGAVLKGAGQARGLSLARGRVIQAFGIFRAEDAVWQSANHPDQRRPSATP